MNASLGYFLTLVLIGATWMFIHGLLVLRIWGGDVSWLQKALAIIPPFTLWFGVRNRYWALTLLWIAVAIGYEIFRWVR